MKTHTPVHNTPAVKPSARKGETVTPAPPTADSLTLPLQTVPTVWRRAAKDLGFPSVEEWAAAMLDVSAWPGGRMTITYADTQMERWAQTAQAQGVNLYAWLETTLDAASEAGKLQTSPQS